MVQNRADYPKQQSMRWDAQSRRRPEKNPRRNSDQRTVQPEDEKKTKRSASPHDARSSSIDSAPVLAMESQAAGYGTPQGEAAESQTAPPFRFQARP